MRRRIPQLLVLVAAVGLGACGSSGAEEDVLATTGGFTAAVNAYDTEAIREFVTADFTWQSTGPVQTLDEYLAYVDANYEAVGFHAEVTGERTIRLDGDAYVVEESGVVTTNNGDLFGITTYRVIETDDGWLIQECRWVETTAESIDGTGQITSHISRHLWAAEETGPSPPERGV